MFGFLATYWWQFLLSAVGGYLLGGINFSVIFSRLIKKGDIRRQGSGNPGTTNVFRVYGLGMGLLTFVCDMLKGLVPCLIVKAVFAEVPLEAAYFTGFFTVTGHIFPPYYKLRGGKGVATSIGMCFAVQPVLTACCILPCIALILITDRMSVMSLSLAVFMITWHWCVLSESVGIPSCVFLTATFVLVLFAHRQNIVRLITGTELKTGVRKAFARNKTTKSDKDAERHNGQSEENDTPDAK